MGLTRTALQRPIFIFMLMIAAFLLGGLSYISMTKELNPDVNLGIVSIATAYPGASPDEVNTLVTKKIEDGIAGVEGIQRITSSSQTGISIVSISFNLNINIDNAVNDIRSKVDQVLPSLPTTVVQPVVSKVDLSAQPILYLAFSATKMNSRDLRDLIDQKLSAEFSQVDGVGEVDTVGGDVREIQVQLDKSKLLAYGIGIADVQQALAASTLNAPAGHITTDSQQLNVRMVGEFEDVNQIKNTWINIQNPTNPQSKPVSVKLTDIADVIDTVQERTQFSRVNGKDSIIVSIQKTKDGNTVDAVNGCESVIKKLEDQYKDVGLKIVITQNQATQILDSLNDLNFTLLFGIALVSLVIFVFLHNLRGTIIVSIAIPLCIFVTFILLKLTGFTINNLSMLALSLAIAVLVDDAIVIIENIYRHLQLGENPAEAALNGRSEIGLAAIAITMADVVVFGPIGFTGGVVGEFLRPLAFGYVFATLTSLFVSFTVTPLLASRWYRKGEEFDNPTGAFAKAFERGFEKFRDWYKRVLDKSLHHRWFVFVLGNIALVAVFMLIGGGAQKSLAAAIGMTIPPIVVCGVIGVIASLFNLLFFRRIKWMLPIYGLLFGLIFPVASVIGYEAQQWKGQSLFAFQFFPPQDTGQLSIKIQLAPDSNLSQTTKVVKYVEGVIMKDPDVKFVNTDVGAQGFSSFSISNQGPIYALVNVTLYDTESFSQQIEFWKKPTEHVRSRTTNEVSSQLLQQIGHVPGASIQVAPFDAFGGGSAIQLAFTSDNRPLLVKTVAAVQKELETGKIKGLMNLSVSSQPGTPEVEVVPDRVKLADAGVSVNQLGTALAILYQGDDNIFLRQNGQEYVVRTMMSYKDRNNPNAINDVPVTFKQGNPIFIPSIADITFGSQLGRIDRLDREEEIQINADLLPSYSQQTGSVQAQINKMLTDEHLVPAGVHYKPLGQADTQSREGGGLILAFVLGLILVYMLLASLFNNLLYPLVIQMAQPQAFVGALLALIITNQSLNIVGFIGLVTLTGLVGKNGILLVDYTNTLRNEGKNRHDSLVESGYVRIRPILMTTFSLIFGLLPVALAIGRGSEFRQSIGIIIIGGTILSTLLTLFVIPCSYTIFDDLTIGISKVMHWLTSMFLRQPIAAYDGPVDFNGPVPDEPKQIETAPDQLH